MRGLGEAGLTEVFEGTIVAEGVGSVGWTGVRWDFWDHLIWLVALGEEREHEKTSKGRQY